MNAIKNGVLASGITFLILGAIIFVKGNESDIPTNVVISVVIGLIAWSLSGRKKA